MYERRYERPLRRLGRVGEVGVPLLVAAVAAYMAAGCAEPSIVGGGRVGAFKPKAGRAGCDGCVVASLSAESGRHHATTG